jgi:hypothetical protein
MGCFNVTALHNFDANRILDLTHYRIWDLVLWWYDVDLIIFDFFLDFFNCISFLLIFINTFFYKIFFNFLNFTIILNLINVVSILNHTCLNFFFYYIFFFFNIIFHFIIFYYELFFFFDLYFSMDGHLLSTTYTYTSLNDTIFNNNVCFFYFLFFLFVLFFFTYVYLFSIKSIFSIVCDSVSNLDIITSINNIKNHIILHFNLFYILKITYIMHGVHTGFYFFLQCFSLFILVLFSLINTFFLVNALNLQFCTLHKNLTLKLTKQNKFFFKLENIVVLVTFKFFKNEIIKHMQINLITFLINFFSYFVKDITYLNSVLYFFFMEMCFTLTIFRNLDNIASTIKTQLTYIKHI